MKDFYPDKDRRRGTLRLCNRLSRDARDSKAATPELRETSTTAITAEADARSCSG